MSDLSWSMYLLSGTKVGLQKDLEHVQRRFTKRLFGLGDMSYVERLAHLYLDTLVDRRNHADFCNC